MLKEIEEAAASEFPEKSEDELYKLIDEPITLLARLSIFKLRELITKFNPQRLPPQSDINDLEIHCRVVMECLWRSPASLNSWSAFMSVVTKECSAMVHFTAAKL